MKKIILLLFFIGNSVTINHLNAYKIHNYSNKKIEVRIYKSTQNTRELASKYGIASYTLAPNTQGSWNWQDLKNKYGGSRNTTYYWAIIPYPATERDGPMTVLNKTIAQGLVPAGGAVAYWGDNRPVGVFQPVTVHFGPDPENMLYWQYQNSPWNLRQQPWQIYPPERYLLD